MFKEHAVEFVFSAGGAFGTGQPGSIRVAERNRGGRFFRRVVTIGGAAGGRSRACANAETEVHASWAVRRIRWTGWRRRMVELRWRTRGAAVG